jgi:hypothetical protein
MMDLSVFCLIQFSNFYILKHQLTSVHFEYIFRLLLKISVLWGRKS